MKTIFITFDFSESFRFRGYFKNIAGNCVSIKAISICFIFFFNNTAYAQLNNDISVISPEASSIGKSIDTRVSYSTGIPDISIPVYDIKYGPLAMPVHLNYFAGGYRVTDVSNWIGLGWTLSADQMVTRVIKGIPDESNQGYFTTGHQLSYCPTQTALDLSFPLHPCLLQQVTNGDKDGEPDLFSYSFNGYSGKFYIGIDEATETLEVRQIDESDVKIMFDYDSGLTQGERIKGFTIFTPEGVKYTFGTQANITAIDKTLINQIGTFNESWRLIQISSYDEKYQIDFAYTPNNYEFFVTSTFSYMLYEHLGNQTIESTTSPSFFKIVNGHRLSGITYGTTTLTFSANTARSDVGTNNKMLDEIQIADGDFCKKFSLTHDYFDAGGTPFTINKRLRLTELHEKICSGVATETELINPYIFEYNGDYLPPLNSRDRDHWGYFNDANNATGDVNIPQVSFTFPLQGNTVTIGNANREADNVAMQTGVLTKITLPAKGHITYEYEANQYYDNVSMQNKLCGGLRIKQITKHDGLNISNDVITTYQYQNTIGNSSGILFNSNGNPGNMPVYSRSFGLLMGNNPCSIPCPYSGTTPGSCGTATVFYCEDESLRPMTSSNGSIIYYEYVTESFSNSGYNTYMYHVPDLPPMGPIFTYPQPPDQISLRAGMLKKQHVINGVSNNAVQDVTHSNTVHYTRSPEYFLMVKPYVLTGTNCNSVDFEYTIYPIYSGHTKLTKIITSTDNISVTKDFEFDSQDRHLMPVSIQSTNSDNKIHRTDLSFVFDYPVTDVKDFLLTHNMIAQPYKDDTYVSNIQVDGSETEFAFFNNNTGIISNVPANSVIRPYKTFRYEKTWDSSGNLTGPGKTLSKTIHQYDVNGNVEDYNFDGWQHTLFQWDNFHKLTNESYLTHHQSYQYYMGSSFLQSTEMIDEQVKTFEYDLLTRLKSISERDGNVLSTFKYHYKSLTDVYNWVSNKNTYTIASGSLLDSIVTKVFADGLGRSIQSNHKYGAPDGSDVITKTEYDLLGRLYRKYEPVSVSGNNGNFYAGAFGGGFSQQLYYSDGLNRISQATPPAWQTTTRSYGTNTGALTSPDGQVYLVNTLMLSTTTDPDSKHTDIYTDRMGRTVLQRQRDVTNTTDTWTTYDDKNRPVKIYPPGSSTSTPELIFVFRYDGDDNVIYKKVPDATAEEYRYSVRNLQTAMRNAVLASQGKWLVTHYDDYGRPIKRGYFVGADPGTVELPTITTLLEEYFYDGYNGSTTDTGPIYTGKLKKSRIKAMEDNGANSNWTETEYFYDNYGRVSTENITNHLSGTETKMYTYDFADHLTSEVHDISGVNGVNHVNNYTYDKQGRKIYDKINLNANGEVTTAVSLYDHKNQMTERNIGRFATTGSHQYLQSLDYTYNPQGWLTGINTLYTDLLPCCFDPCAGDEESIQEDENNTTINNTDDQDLFALAIDYNSTLVGSGVPANQNGNITALKWWHRNNYNQAYSYTYDHLNRVKEARQGEIIQGVHTLRHQYNEKFEYDPRGNITKLDRKGMVQRTDLNELCYQPLTIDSLAYAYQDGTNKLIQVIDKAPCADTITLPAEIDRDIHYAAGQLIRVLDSDVLCGVDMKLTAGVRINIIDTLKLPVYCGTPAYVHAYQGPCPDDKYTEGFSQQSINGLYLYDAAGNLTFDPNKKLTFYYNHHNLPYKITGAENDELQMWYGADGTLLQRKYIKNNVEINKTDYLRGKEYKSDILESVYHADGRAIKNGASWKYEYHIKDHLGNIRVTFVDDNNNGIIAGPEIRSRNDYYSFGMEWDGRWSQSDTISPKNKYKYNGKELFSEMDAGVYAYGKRFFDPVLGRFLETDPIASKFPHINPYNYAENRVPNAIDLHGLQAILHVNLINGNSKTNYSVDVSKVSNPKAVTYANQEKYGKRGELTVVKNLINDATIEKFEIGFKDRVLNFLDKESSEPEQVDGGIMFTMTDGQGKENRFSADATIGANLDDLLNVFGVAKSLGNELKSFPEVFQYIMDAKGLGDQINITYPSEKHVNKSDSVECPTCKYLQDSAHIDAVNGRGQFNELINKLRNEYRK